MQEYLVEDNIPCSKLWLVRITEDSKPDQSINQWIYFIYFYLT